MGAQFYTDEKLRLGAPLRWPIDVERAFALFVRDAQTMERI